MAVDDETARWLAALDDAMTAKLAAVGLTAPRANTTLGGWIDKYLAEKRVDLKPESMRKLRQTEAKLMAYLDPETRIRKITPDHAAQWRQWMKGEGLSEAAVKTHSGNAKTIFAEAVRRELIDRSPFRVLRSGPTPSRCTHYVTPTEIEAVIEACPDTEWRLLFGLARYAGLRIPSESHRLTWADVDWRRGRLNVHSPKTEHHEGHARRSVPITPALMPLLQDRFEVCEAGEERLVSIGGKGAVQRRVRAICKRAGVEPWPRLWQTLRSSCEKQWAMKFPQYAVSKWIGHSITVSGRHYTNGVPDELFEIAAGGASPGGPEADLRTHSAQHSAEPPRMALQAAEAGPSDDLRNVLTCNDLHDSATLCDARVDGAKNGAGGNRTPVP